MSSLLPEENDGTVPEERNSILFLFSRETCERRRRRSAFLPSKGLQTLGKTTKKKNERKEVSHSGPFKEILGFVCSSLAEMLDDFARIQH